MRRAAVTPSLAEQRLAAAGGGGVGVGGGGPRRLRKVDLRIDLLEGALCEQGVEELSAAEALLTPQGGGEGSGEPLVERECSPRLDSEGGGAGERGWSGEVRRACTM